VSPNILSLHLQFQLHLLQSTKRQTPAVYTRYHIVRASPPVLSMTLQKYFLHPSLVITLFQLHPQN
jgi:hypothetical protein